ncbi:MAG: tripartite tricarboxylate transporter substrate binding protein [Rhodospirillaceae bacterium]
MRIGSDVGRALCCMAIAALSSVAAAAQSGYPTRPIRVIVPYPPGGITDITTRMVSQEISKTFSQNVIVDNRPGANSILGVEIVAKATPDGYTLASVIAAHAANQTLYPKLPYDSIKSFEPVSLLATAPLIMCVTNALPAKSVKELIDLAKQKPGQLTFASSGIGAAAHLTTELLMILTGTKLVHVPYKGTAPALQDLIGGQVTIMMDTSSSMMPHVRAGKIRALGMASEKRAAVAPDVPTFIEQGVPLVSGTWVGMLAPAKTPGDIVERLSAAMSAAVQRPEVRQRFMELGIDPVGNSPAEFRKFLEDEVAKWAKVIKTANVKVEM